MREIIDRTDFPGLLVDGGPSRGIIVRHYSSGVCTGPWPVVGQEDDFSFVEVEVAQRGFEVLTAHPVCTCGSIDFAVLGLLGKMSGPAAIRSLSYQVISENNSAQVEIGVGLKALGLLGTYILTYPMIHVALVNSHRMLVN